VAVRRIANCVSAILISAFVLAGVDASWLAGAPFAGAPWSATLHHRTIAADVAGAPLRLFSSTRQLRSAAHHAIAAPAFAQVAAARSRTPVRRLQAAAPSATEGPHGSRAPPAPSLS
jgi:hypothetical protein